LSNDACDQTLAQIEHIALVTSDLERLSAFYGQLGAVASPPSTDLNTGLRTCVLDFFGIRLEVFERRGGGEGVTDDEGSPGLLHLGFALESADAVDELTSVIAAAGYRVVQPPRRAGELGRYESVVLDPDGNRLKLTV
jgi:lactoylglutathione lyase